jgi:hypothetical protein
MESTEILLGKINWSYVAQHWVIKPTFLRAVLTLQNSDDASWNVKSLQYHRPINVFPVHVGSQQPLKLSLSFCSWYATALSGHSNKDVCLPATQMGPLSSAAISYCFSQNASNAIHYTATAVLTPLPGCLCWLSEDATGYTERNIRTKRQNGTNNRQNHNQVCQKSCPGDTSMLTTVPHSRTHGKRTVTWNVCPRFTATPSDWRCPETNPIARLA